LGGGERGGGRNKVPQLFPLMCDGSDWMHASREGRTKGEGKKQEKDKTDETAQQEREEESKKCFESARPTAIFEKTTVPTDWSRGS